MADLTIVAVIVFFTGCVVSFLLYAHFEISGEEAFWWPITLAKALVKSLYNVCTRW